MPSAYKIEFCIESLSGEKLFGFVVVGIPENQFLELKAKFPDVGFKGQNPEINEAIKEGFTEEEKERIRQKLDYRLGIESPLSEFLAK